MMTDAAREEAACTCGAGHGSGENHTVWCDWLDDPAAIVAAAKLEADEYSDGYTAADLEAVARAALEAAVGAYEDGASPETWVAFQKATSAIRALDPAAIVAAHTGGDDRDQ